MTPSRPYLIRALYEWIVDNQLTPYLLVDATQEDVVIPKAFVDDGKIILNVSPEATHSLVLGNDFIVFNARFSGNAMDVSVPVGSVNAIYARENGQGMVFGKHDDIPPEPGTDKKKKKPSANEIKRPNLKIVK